MRDLELRIIQWREHGDDDDTMTIRIVTEDDKVTNHDWLCELHDLDAELDFDEGGITIIDSVRIFDGSVFRLSGGQKVRVKLELIEGETEELTHA